MEEVIKYLCYHKPEHDFSCGENLSRNEMRTKALDMIKKAESSDLSNDLTTADCAAWWTYLKLYLPKNFERAMLHKHIKQDTNIGDLKGVENLHINDYFELYSLPRVKAANGVIFVNGENRIRYANRYSYFINRDIFTLAHKNRCFYAWKDKQLNQCQDGRCAWCRKHVELKDSEVDHILPLIFFGKNEPWNMVVACKDCNKAKSSNTKGWNDTGNNFLSNKKPKWIQRNGSDFLMRKALAEAKKEYKKREDLDSKKIARQNAPYLLEALR